MLTMGQSLLKMLVKSCWIIQDLENDFAIGHSSQLPKGNQMFGLERTKGLRSLSDKLSIL